MTTAVHFRDLYPWFYIPVSLHKLLIHSADVIRSHLLPIGMYSEEAQEARNKHVGQYRIKHARNTSRTNTLVDQFSHLLATSDPIVSNLITSHIESRERRHRVDVGKSDDVCEDSALRVCRRNARY